MIDITERNYITPVFKCKNAVQYKFIIAKLKEFGYKIDPNSLYCDSRPYIVIDYNSEFGNVCNMQNRCLCYCERYIVKYICEFLYTCAKLKGIKDYKINNNDITVNDAIGDVLGFPIEVLQKMMYEQYNQGNPMDIKVFQNKKDATTYNGGFYWEETIDGYEFWKEVINNENFELFFSRYSKEKNDNVENKYIENMKENQYLPIELIKPGMVVVARNGKAYLVIKVTISKDKEEIIFMNSEGYMDLNSYDNYLKSRSGFNNGEFDIVKIYDTKYYYGTGFNMLLEENIDDYTLIYDANIFEIKLSEVYDLISKTYNVDKDKIKLV